jgi:hypothetical protein
MRRTKPLRRRRVCANSNRFLYYTLCNVTTTRLSHPGPNRTPFTVTLTHLLIVAPEPTGTSEPVAEAPAVAAEPQPSKPTSNAPPKAHSTGKPLLVKPIPSSQSDCLTAVLCPETTSLAPPQPARTSREGSATTDTKLASAVDRSIGLSASSVDEELRKRKARAERFGTGATTTESAATGTDAETLKALERAKRFGTGQIGDGAGVGKLDEALPMEREKGGKRGLEESAYDDPGLKPARGGKRRFHGRGGRDSGRRGEKPDGVKKQSATVSERDRAAAEARKKRFAAS